MRKFEEGWIKLERKVLTSPIWRSDEIFNSRDAYIDLRLLANYESHDCLINNGKQIIKVNKNQLFTSYATLADRWMWDRKTVINYLSRLERLGFITKHGTANGTLITLILPNVDESGDTTKRTTERTAERTAGGTTDRTATRTAERTAPRTRCKKGKNSKESQEEQEPKNTAKRTGFVWGEDE